MNSDLVLAEKAARQAGEVVRGYFRSEFEVREKGVDNPVTTADLEADQILKTTLLGARPEDGWLSEETVDSPERLSRSRVWIVDPIDGTKEFIKGVPQFAISIALAVEGEIAVAVIYNPALDEMFCAVKGEGLTLNGEPVQTTPLAVLESASILASRSEVARGEFDRFEDGFTITPIGSIAYKLALVASGKADLTFTLTPKNEWDFAAGTLLLTEGGGQFRILGRDTQRFNQPDPLVKGLVASNGPLYGPLMQMLELPTR